MINNTDFVPWLSRKIYEINIGFYVTIALVMSLPYFLGMAGLPAFAARFCAFFIVSFTRAAYESVVVYESPVKNLSVPKMLLLTFVTSGMLSLFAHYLRPQLGAFAIPVSLIFSMLVVNKLKAFLWKPTVRHGFLALLPAKLNVITWSRYGFFALLVGITYCLYGKLDVTFYAAFALAYFVGMLCEELYNTIYLYELPITVRTGIIMVLWSFLCALLSAVLVFVVMQMLGYSGQIATIASVIAIKLIQPVAACMSTKRV